MTQAPSFSSLCELLHGTWIGDRTRVAGGADRVMANWRATLDGKFLMERWYVSAPGGGLVLTAQGLIKVAEGTPGEHVIAYRSGRIALGESSFREGRWTFTQGWLGAPAHTRIRLRLLDDACYEQEVHALDPTGAESLENRSILYLVDP